LCPGHYSLARQAKIPLVPSERMSVAVGLFGPPALF
jgi:hypothetical protein